MPERLERYGLLGDTRTAALVARGSIDWLCLPDFDSGACFAALLGDSRHGHWTVAPRAPFSVSECRYREETLVLETRMVCDDGEVRVVDCMPIRGQYVNLVRRVEGVRGVVDMRSDFVPRFDYGSRTPWLRGDGRRLHALAGPDHLVLDSDVHLDDTGDESVTDFRVRAGQTVDFRLAWAMPRQSPPARLDVQETIDRTTRWWRDWVSRCEYSGGYRDPVMRSLVTLKALTYAPSGGMVAAPTTSLPELLGGGRNWDYRLCWIRDATFTLMVLLDAGYQDEAEAWREWLLRAVAGRPEQIQSVYGLRGERRVPEVDLDWLPGYAASRPVRIGNQAAQQFQLDMYGELMDALHQARMHGIPADLDAWHLQQGLMDFLESNWTDPDRGIWEIRGRPRHFTHSRVMAWSAADRAVQAVERFDLDGPVDSWKRLRQEIFDDVCERGYDAERGTFTQYYGSKSLDAALLRLPNVGFLPASDPRMRGTTAAIEEQLVQDGLVRRYPMDGDAAEAADLRHGEGAFLPCSFWLADNYALRGDDEQACRLFERVLELSSDVGLLSEEYEPETGQVVGNYPQALTHLLLVNTAFNLSSTQGPVHRRANVG